MNRGQLFDATGIEQSSSNVFTSLEARAKDRPNSFVVVKQNTGALLTWTKTGDETADDHYLVERCGDGNRFTEIATVDNNVITTSGNDFKISDDKPFEGINYYRIKRINASGVISFSKVRSLIFNARLGTVFITPNPARDHVTVTVSGNTKLLNLVLKWCRPTG